MIKKVLLFLSATVLMICPSFASVDSIITTKGYVDTEIETKQLKIPAAGAPNVGIGDSVITYTNTDGSLGERGVYTGANDYDATSDSDKLITASALNSAFTTLPALETNRLTCANPGTCNLWAITPQTAYGRAAAPAIDLSALGNTNGTAACMASLSGSGEGAQYDSGCITALTNYGEWGVVFPYNDSAIQVSGISACSTVYENIMSGRIPTNQSGVQSDYESNTATVPNSNPVGGNCYCKMTDPTTAAARWVFVHSFSSQDVSVCANECVDRCAASVMMVPLFRANIFGVQQ